jgi:central glycolytic genes regulator
MDHIIQLHKKIAPKLIEAVETRYNILRHIYYVQPIGRRALAGQLAMGERFVRAETEFFKAQGLLDITPAGMTVTPEGEALLTSLIDYIHKLRGLSGLEQQLADKLELRQAVIIPGNCDCDGTVKKELGQATARLLEQYIADGTTLAVTGGTTTAEVATALHTVKNDVLVLPARGGLGEEVEYQANTIAAAMAKKLGGSYRLLYLPDLLSPETINTIASQDPGVREVLTRLKHTDVLVFSIGRADTLARVRGLSEAKITELTSNGATGEALGYYFNLQGKVVYMNHSVGLHMEDVTNIKTVIAVAGGHSKAAAIVSVLRHNRHQMLITDEAAAKKMLTLL